MTFSDREYVYVGPILAGLTELGHAPPREIAKAVEASEIHPSAVGERYAADALAAPQGGKPLPDYGAELAAAEAALRWRNVKVDALAEAQGMAAASVAGAVGRSSETIYGILRKSLADILAQVRKLEPVGAGPAAYQSGPHPAHRGSREDRSVPAPSGRGRSAQRAAGCAVPAAPLVRSPSVSAIM